MHLSGSDKFFYYRWGGFYQGLQQCRNGILIQSYEHLIHILNPDTNIDVPRELTGLMADMFLADFATRRAVHFSPQLRNIEQ
jgi:hypothetical protein